eukprot:902070-Rhodomonas_salina.6
MWCVDDDDDDVACAGARSAFYFVFHTTTPMVSDWMKKGASRNLTWEFDFAYFYSSLLSILAIGCLLYTSDAADDM